MFRVEIYEYDFNGIEHLRYSYLREKQMFVYTIKNKGNHLK